VLRVSKIDPRNCRSLGFARDDKGKSSFSWKLVGGQKAFFKPNLDRSG
jgi:hypothetical protein